ncbi:MAG TPA: AI-2E family transporter, partial [Planctomycetota bacterium]|nr:AI-2E family transporter [Planctomycetota bacterium]
MTDHRATAWLRPVFFGVSAGVAAIVVLLARDVMLPFVLAVVIAYVLAPLVDAVERRKVPRPLAVVVVYAGVLGSIGGFLSGVTPRIALEFRNLRGELPTLANEAHDKWVPAITDRLRALGLAPALPPPDDSSDQGPAGAFIVRPQPDGTTAIDVGTGVSVTETRHGWLVEPTRDRREEAFDPNRLVADAIGRTFTYAQHNSLEIARAVRDLVAGISRVVFVFFITLMLAAYMMITRERIGAFFRSLVRPAGRPSFDALLARVDEGLS